jgi:ParB family transcriptional regulator, chromosome partitioning protein
VRVEPQTARNDATQESVEASASEAAFDERRRAVLGLLGFDADTPTVIGGNADPYGLVGLFRRLLELPDPCVLDIIAIVIGESLAAGSAAVEAVGVEIGIDMADHWHADDAFFALLRDRDVLTHIVAEVAGESAASANASEKAKTMKTVIADALEGQNGRAKVERWVPRWMTFPPAAYTNRGGVGTMHAAAIAAAASEETGKDVAETAEIYAIPGVEDDEDAVVLDEAA